MKSPSAKAVDSTTTSSSTVPSIQPPPANGILRYLVAGATAGLQLSSISAKPSMKGSFALPPISDDANPAIVAYGKRLVDLHILTSRLNEIEAKGYKVPLAQRYTSIEDEIVENDDDSSMDHESITSYNENSSKPKSKSNKQGNEDVGSKGRVEAQFWLDAYSGIVPMEQGNDCMETNESLESLPTTLLPHPNTRALTVTEFMDLQMIVDFIKAFGSDFLYYDIPADFSLASLKESLETPSLSAKLLPKIYTSLIRILHNDKRWTQMTTTIETPALIIHHLLTVPFPQSSSPIAQHMTPSIDALITFFTDLTFPQIPPPVHIRLLNLLVQDLMDTERFHSFMESQVVACMDAKRKLMIVNGKKRVECRGICKGLEVEVEKEGNVVKRLEREIRALGNSSGSVTKMGDEETEVMDDIVCDEDGVGVVTLTAEPTGAEDVQMQGATVAVAKTGASPNGSATSSSSSATKQSRNVSREVEKMKRAAESTLNAKLAPLVKELNKKVTQLHSLEREMQDLDKEDASLKHEIETLNASQMRVSRVLGMDRDFSAYYWVDYGLPITVSSTVILPPSFGVLVIESLSHPQKQSAPKIKTITSLSHLKTLLKSLNDRGTRERHLLTSLKEKLALYSLEFPAFPTHGTKRAWETLNPDAKIEDSVDAAIKAFATCVEGLGTLLAAPDDDTDHVYHATVLEGVRGRMRDLVSTTGVNTPTLYTISRLETMQEFLESIQQVIGGVYGLEEGKEVVERFEGVSNWSLFSVAVGFVVKDVKSGKVGREGREREEREKVARERKERIEKKEKSGAGWGEMEEDEREEVEEGELKPRSCKAKAVSFALKPRPGRVVKKSSRRGGRETVQKQEKKKKQQLVRVQRSTRSKASVSYEESGGEEEEDDEVEGSESGSGSDKEEDGSESEENNEDGDDASDDVSESSEEEAVVVSTLVTRRKRHSDEINDENIGRVTRSRHGSETRSAIARLSQSRTFRLKADIQFHRKNRIGIALSTNHPIALVFPPAADIASFVANGNVDLGITGQDMVAEADANVEELLQLCKLSVQAPIESSSTYAKDLVGRELPRVSPRLLGNYLRMFICRQQKEAGLAQVENPTRVQFLSGSVEVSCALGLADAIVGRIGGD
ncbi:UNVERIFIED_CONTAM: ATP phosphoribosyltransferase (ATP-PRTase) (ATP-PRT) [Siphonaria sp. JEL0065]|nr:ATP phosphoribosyltransferase (ATP-PRTase) (ATP-PRT) [Siphonaria sp. JEL0065]